jgi:hypothetical protein
LPRRTDGNQARVLEHTEVLGDRLLGDVEMCRNLVDGPGLVANQHEDRAATRLGERSQGSFGSHDARISTLALYKW